MNLPGWQVLLIFWVVLWGLQTVGVWYQTRRYTRNLSTLQKDYQTGYLGTGHSPRRLGRGAIVMIVADKALKVERFLVMQGMTFFADFKDMPEYTGLSVPELQQELAKKPEKSSLRTAAESALTQILRVQRDRETAIQKAAPELAHA